MSYSRQGFLLGVLLLQLVSEKVAATVLGDDIDTRRGSDSSYTLSRGNTFPAAAYPFGFNLWTPVTQLPQQAPRCSAADIWRCRYAAAQLYRYAAPSWVGVAVSHQPSPWMGDYGTLLLWSGAGDPDLTSAAPATPYVHAQELARPAHYEVRLNSGQSVGVAPSMHAAVLRFRFPVATRAFVVFDTLPQVEAHFEVQADGAALQGFTVQQSQKMYFYATWRQGSGGSFRRMQKPPQRAWSSFRVAAQQPAELYVATSWLSVAAARYQLEQEVQGRSWEAVAQAGQQAWQEVLGKIEVEGSPAQQRTFYANMYRAHLFPTARAEQTASGVQYHSPYDQQVHAGHMWVNNGFWDTYRAVWPLHTLLRPRQTGAMLQGFVAAAQQGGWTPRWSAPGYRDVMLGTHTDIVFADAARKGVSNFDLQGAYAAALKNATVYSAAADRGRAGLQRSNFLGYLPTELARHAAAWFLEDRINDYGIALLAADLGQTATATYMQQRALQYVNLFSPSVDFFRGRNLAGTWRSPDNAFAANMWGHEFIEGCAWHYLAAAPHDVQGMANLYGGRDALARKIDTLLNASSNFLVGSYGQVIHEMTEAAQLPMGQYAHPNEPVHHMLYMYNYVGQPAKTAQYVRRVLDPNIGIYDAALGGGYLGDEDNGQMSAWYVFSAMGFYPAAPGHAEYALGSPLFRQVVIHLENGNNFTLQAPQNSDTNIYIQSAQLNGQAYHHNYLRHADILRGGTLVLDMGPQPSSWGTSAAALPSSMTPATQLPCPQSDFTAPSQLSIATAALADNDSTTSWQSSTTAPQITYQLPQPQQAIQYTLTSSAATARRDPYSWTLSASQNGRTWDVLDEQHNIQFTWRLQTQVWSIARPATYRYYRFVFAAPTNEPLQLAELELLGPSANCSRH